MSEFPNPGTAVPELRSIAESWALSSSLHQWERGADEASISSVEGAIGRLLPPALHALYRMSDGFYLLEGSLVIEPLQPVKEGALALVNYSDKLREWKWPIPEELVVFGGNGSDEIFGVWLPKGSGIGEPHPIIEVGEIFDDEKAFAVVGTDLCKFLRAWTAYHTMLCLPEKDQKATKKALKVLGVPQSLWRMNFDDVDDSLMMKLFEWSDPELPDYFPDPYERGVSSSQLGSIYGRNR